MSDQHTLARVQRGYERTYGNKLWRMTHLYKIQDKKRRMGYLKPNNIQRAMNAAVQPMVDAGRALRAFFLKFRQGGVSTWWLIWHLDDTIWTPNTITGVLAHKQDSLRKLFKIVQVAYKTMPPGLRPPLKEDTKSSMEFSGGVNSTIAVGLEIRSTVIHNLHISEWCFCNDTSVQASIGAVPPDGNITGESTANGVGNDGHITYTEAKLKLNDYVSAFYPWFIQDEYRLPLMGAVIRRTDEENRMASRALSEYGVTISDEQIMWRRVTKRNLKGLFKQEFPENDEEAFLTSGRFFFNQNKIITLLNEAKHRAMEAPPIEETDDFSVWERPIKGDIYVAGGDVAEGIGGDFSVLAIINVTKRRQAFRYRAQCGVSKFTDICDERGREYFNARMAVENNNHGNTVNELLLNIKRYPNIYTEERKTRIIVRPGTPVRDQDYGWKTTNANRTPMLDSLKMAVEGEDEEDVEHFEPEWTTFDQDFLQEALNFQEIEGKFQAGPGKHDDTIFAWGLAHQMYQKLKPMVTRRDSGMGGVRALGEREFKG